MTFPVTLALFLAAVGLALFAGWRGAQPPNLLKGVRLAPWRLIMVLGTVAALVFLVHLANLVGIKTGR